MSNRELLSILAATTAVIEDDVAEVLGSAFTRRANYNFGLFKTEILLRMDRFCLAEDSLDLFEHFVQATREMTAESVSAITQEKHKALRKDVLLRMGEKMEEQQPQSQPC